MGERQFFGVQKKPAKRIDGIADIGIGDGVVAALVVDLVADDRVIDIAHVDADLVRAAGFDLDVEQREFFKSLSHFPEREGTAAVGGDLHPQAVVLVAADRRLDLAGILSGEP